MADDGNTVVLHVDLDCFYAAVEHVRLGIPTQTPLAVQQWEGLIAVNYAARAAGVARHDRVRDAVQKCPDLQLVHVETVGGNNEDPDAAPSRSTSKVSLERYRQASSQVFTIFRRFAPVCERASIDEAYLDVTTSVDDMLSTDVDWTRELERLTAPNESGNATTVIEGGPLVLSNEYDRRLLAGAVVADSIRAAIRGELGYTCSVGIAPNKLLAKIASARHKPDRETVVLPRAVETLMQDLPLKKIKLLGGKLGEVLRDRWMCNTAGDAQALSHETLVTCFGERLGGYAWRAVRGIQNDKVEAKQMPKSMLAAKSFTATSDTVELRRWTGVLADELSLRILRDLHQNHRQPRLLQLYYRHSSSDHSKSCPMPHAAFQLFSSLKCPPREAESCKRLENWEQESLQVSEATGEWPCPDTVKALAAILESTAFHIFQQLIHGGSLTRLAIAATQFEALPNQGAQSIQRYFQVAGKQEQQEKHEQRTTPPRKPSHQSTKGILNFYVTDQQQHHHQHQEQQDYHQEHHQPEQQQQQDSVHSFASESESSTVIDLDSIDVEEQHRILNSLPDKKTKKRKSTAGDGLRTISSFFQPSKGGH